MIFFYFSPFIEKSFTEDDIDPRLCRNLDLILYEGLRDQIMNGIHRDFINLKVLGHFSFRLSLNLNFNRFIVCNFNILKFH